MCLCGWSWIFVIQCVWYVFVVVLRMWFELVVGVINVFVLCLLWFLSLCCNISRIVICLVSCLVVGVVCRSFLCVVLVFVMLVFCLRVGILVLNVSLVFWRSFMLLNFYQSFFIKVLILLFFLSFCQLLERIKV